MNRDTKIIIVEDDDSIRKELKLFLCNAGYEAEYMLEIGEAKECANAILLHNPDLVLLDMNLPETNGLLICDKLRSRSKVPIIFVTGNDTTMDELNCMMRGGDDYIAKPYQLPVLLAHISAVLRRTSGDEKKEKLQYEYKGVLFDVAAGTISRDEECEELTRNEIKITYYLFRHPKEIVSRTDLIDYLWDNEVFIDDNTLSVNITRIRKKLEKIGVTNFIETRHGMGYRI